MLATGKPEVKETLQAVGQASKPQGAPRDARRRWDFRTRVTLSSFLAWYGQHDRVLAELNEVPDGRDPARTRIPLPAILLGGLCLYWLNLRSLLALDDRLKVSPDLRQVLQTVGWGEPISDSAIANALQMAEIEGLRRLCHLQGKRQLFRWRTGPYLACQLAQRLQTVGASGLAARAIVALDGHEIAASEQRCCPDCHVRQVLKKRGRHKVWVPEYYHKAVFAQWVGTHPAVILDLEPIRPYEGEMTAAYRLTERLRTVYGDTVGTLVMDALYDCDKVRGLVRDAGWYTVIRHREDREPGRSCGGHLNRRDPTRASPDWAHREGPLCHYRGWVETDGGRRYVEVQRFTRVGDKERIQLSACVTDLPPDKAPPAAVAMIMEARWGIENTGFHELAGPWAMDRFFVHEGRPNAAWAMVFLAVIAYNAFHVYVYRELVLDPTHPERTLLALRRDFLETLHTFGQHHKPRARSP